MAFKKNINDLSGILVLVLLYLPAISANIDCNGKPFHCVNTTHFMICVDLGSGVSSTIDDFIIPCPPTTVCLGTNRFECEFPAVTTTTTTIDVPRTLVTETVYSETVWTETKSAVNDVTTSIPFEEYFNTISSTTLSDVTVSTQPTIETEPSGAVSDFTENINVISTLNDVLPSVTVNVEQNDSTKLNDRNSTVLPNKTVSESIMNLTGSLNVASPDLKSTFNQTISDDVQNTLTLKITNNTQNSTLPYNIDLNIMSDFNSTLSEAITSESADTVKYEMTTLAIPRSTGYLVKTESALTDVTQSLSVNKQESEYDSTSRYEQHSTVLSKIDYDAITNATAMSRLKLNPVLNEATSIVLVDAVQYEPTTIVIPSSTDLPIDIGTNPIVTDGTGNLTWMKYESNSSNTIPIASYDVQNETNMYTRNKTYSSLTGATGNLSEVSQIYSENKSASSQTISIISYDVYNDTNEYKQNSNLTNQINNITVSNATKINATQLDIYPILNEAIPSAPVDAVPYEPAILVTPSSEDIQTNIGTDLVLTDVTENLSDIKEDSISQIISIVSYDLYNGTNRYEQNSNVPDNINNNNVSKSTDTNMTKFDIYPISNESISTVPVDVVPYEPTILVIPSSMDLMTNVSSGSILGDATGNLSDIKQNFQNHSSSSHTISSVSHRVYNDTLYEQNSNLSININNDPVSNSTEKSVTKLDIYPISNEAISSAPVEAVPYQTTILVTPSSIDLPIYIGPDSILTGNSSEIKNVSENKSVSNQTIATASYDVYNDTNLYKQNSNLPNELNTVSNSTETDVTQSDIYPILKADNSTAAVDAVPYESTIIVTSSGVDLQNNFGTGSKLADATGNLSDIKQSSQNQYSSSQTMSIVSYEVYNGTDGYEQNSNLSGKINNNNVSNSTESNMTKLDIYPILNEAISNPHVEAVPHESTVLVTPIDLPTIFGPDSILKGNLSEIKHPSENNSFTNQKISIVSYGVYNDTNKKKQNSTKQNSSMNKLNTVTNSIETNVNQFEFESNEPTTLVQPSGIDYSNDIVILLNNGTGDINVIEKVPQINTALTTTVAADDSATTPCLPNSLDIPLNLLNESTGEKESLNATHEPEYNSNLSKNIPTKSNSFQNDFRVIIENGLDKIIDTEAIQTNTTESELITTSSEVIPSVNLNNIQKEKTSLTAPSSKDLPNNSISADMISSSDIVKSELKQNPILINSKVSIDVPKNNDVGLSKLDSNSTFIEIISKISGYEQNDTPIYTESSIVLPSTREDIAIESITSLFVDSVPTEQTTADTRHGTVFPNTLSDNIMTDSITETTTERAVNKTSVSGDITLKSLTTISNPISTDFQIKETADAYFSSFRGTTPSTVIKENQPLFNTTDPPIDNILFNSIADINNALPTIVTDKNETADTNINISFRSKVTTPSIKVNFTISSSTEMTSILSTIKEDDTNIIEIIKNIIPENTESTSESVSSINNDNIYFYNDTENITNVKEILALDGKPILNEKVLSTYSTDKIAAHSFNTPAKEEILTKSSISATDTTTDVLIPTLPINLTPNSIASANKESIAINTTSNESEKFSFLFNTKKPKGLLKNGIIMSEQSLATTLPITVTTTELPKNTITSDVTLTVLPNPAHIVFLPNQPSVVTNLQGDVTKATTEEMVVTQSLFDKLNTVQDSFPKINHDTFQSLSVMEGDVIDNGKLIKPSIEENSLSTVKVLETINQIRENLDEVSLESNPNFSTNNSSKSAFISNAVGVTKQNVINPSITLSVEATSIKSDTPTTTKYLSSVETNQAYPLIVDAITDLTTRPGIASNTNSVTNQNIKYTNSVKKAYEEVSVNDQKTESSNTLTSKIFNASDVIKKSIPILSPEKKDIKVSSDIVVIRTNDSFLQTKNVDSSVITIITENIDIPSTEPNNPFSNILLNSLAIQTHRTSTSGRPMVTKNIKSNLNENAPLRLFTNSIQKTATAPSLNNQDINNHTKQLNENKLSDIYNRIEKNASSQPTVTSPSAINTVYLSEMTSQPTTAKVKPDTTEHKLETSKSKQGVGINSPRLSSIIKFKGEQTHNNDITTETTNKDPNENQIEAPTSTKKIPDTIEHTFTVAADANKNLTLASDIHVEITKIREVTNITMSTQSSLDQPLTLKNLDTATIAPTLIKNVNPAENANPLIQTTSPFIQAHTLEPVILTTPQVTEININLTKAPESNHAASQHEIANTNTQMKNQNYVKSNTPDADFIILNIGKSIHSTVRGENSNKTHSGTSSNPKLSKKFNELSEKSEAQNKNVTNKNLGIPDSHKLTSSNKLGQEQNETFDRKGTLDISVSRLPFNKEIPKLDNTIVKPPEQKEDAFGSNIMSNIELAVVNSTRENAARNNTAVKPQSSSNFPNKSSVVNSSTESNVKSENIIINSNIISSTARYTPPAKTIFVNTHKARSLATTSNGQASNFVCKNRGRYSDETDCRKFYICIGKPQPIQGKCPNDTVFSEIKKQCTKNLSHCYRNNQFRCVSEGRFFDLLKDNIYYICVKNNVGTFIRFKLQCQSGYHLNKTSVRCVLNIESSQTISSNINTNNKNVQSVSTVRSQKNVESTEKSTSSDNSQNNSDQSLSSSKVEDVITSKPFECKEEGKFADAINCRKYYICTKRNKSRYRIKSKICDSDEIFHKDKKKCVDADSYECS